MTMEVTCTRCGVQRAPATISESGRLHLPEGWEGTVKASPDVQGNWFGEAHCPGCQLAEHHPRCMSVRSDFGYGGRVDLEALDRGEQVTFTNQDDDVVTARSPDDIDLTELGYCDHFDLSINWFEGDDWPKDWRCPECGGTEFEFVHRDYLLISR
jgi:hypothetical protein